MTTPVGRLAPTPSGAIHLGNACAFAAAWLSARAARGRLLLRIEDVDRERASPQIADAIRRDLSWLGLSWDEEVAPQSARDYRPWLARLSSQTYHCRCTRAMTAAVGGVYAGVCRDRGWPSGAVRFRLPDRTVVFDDRVRGTQAVSLGSLGDPVLRRRDGEFAYMLAVVADDIADGVTEVVRGADLLETSAAQICLWEALGGTPPTWLHAPLVVGPDGRKLSKSHGALAIGALRAAGWRPGDVWRVVLPWLGLSGVATLEDAVPRFDPDTIWREAVHVDRLEAGAIVVREPTGRPR